MNPNGNDSEKLDDSVCSPSNKSISVSVHDEEEEQNSSARDDPSYPDIKAKQYP